MIPEDLMRKYKYGYVHSCNMLNEPVVKDLIKENKELKKQLKEKNEGFIASVEELTEYAEENERLKNCYCNRADCSSRIKDSKRYDSLVQKVEKQQKEFIEWLKNEIKRMDKLMDTGAPKPYGEEKHLYQNSKARYVEILSKYKEITGVKDERIRICCIDTSLQKG